MSFAYDPFIGMRPVNLDYNTRTVRLRLGSRAVAIGDAMSLYDIIPKIEDEFERAVQDERKMLQARYAMQSINSAQTEEIKKLQKKRNEEDKLKDLIAHYYSKGQNNGIH